MDTKKYNFRVITFNLLSSDYERENYYPTIPTHYLAFKFRKKRTMTLISSWIKHNYIICLQEVNTKWDDMLKSFFFDTSLYGYQSVKYANDKMGVAIAYPFKYYELLKYDVQKCSDLIQKKFNKLTDICQMCPISGMEMTGQNQHDIKKISPEIISSDETETLLMQLKEASLSPNLFLTVLLKVKSKKKCNIMISTYHMPCRYDMKYFLIAHIETMKHIIYTLKNMWQNEFENVQTTVLAGDFNISDKDSIYKYMTDETYTDDELENSASFIANMSRIYKMINCDIMCPLKLKSAYRTLHGCEPVYTNVSVKDDIFMEPLDYILIDDNAEIKSALVGLTLKNPEIISYPNWICPSDHLPLSASLQIKTY